jgi:hypothetical protein
MPKRTSKQTSDPVQNAFRVVQESIQDHEPVHSKALVSQIMSEMGRKGGKIGGKRRLKTMTAERRREVAQLAANKRWAKARKSQKTKKNA